MFKWFNVKRGFGFIQGEDGRDYFIHFSQITELNEDNLIQGQTVRFSPSASARGELAVDVELL